ncbi:MAG: hypothetical protein U1F30_13475 [Steroidobacteraceae bacterium]
MTLRAAGALALAGAGSPARAAAADAPATAAPAEATVARPAAPPAAQTRPLLDSARLWRARGRDDLATAALRKLLAIAPEDRAALRLLAAIEIEAGRYAAADGLIARLAQAWPDAPEARELRDLLALARSQGRRAARDRLHAIDALPLDSPPLPRARRNATHARRHGAAAGTHAAGRRRHREPGRDSGRGRGPDDARTTRHRGAGARAPRRRRPARGTGR